MAVTSAENKNDEPQIAADSSGASQSTMEKAALEAASQGASSDTAAPDVPPFGLEDEKPPLRIPLPRFILLASAICLAFFLALLDTSIVATSLHVIALEFQDTETIYWVALSYTLAYLSCAVLFARVSDVIGRRAAVLGAYVIFIAFSLACGWSQNLPQLIAFRALQGVGGSGMPST
jgi:hypothetical protein